MQNSQLTRRYIITGSQRFSNYLWAFLISLGGAGFLITGFISFLKLKGERFSLDKVPTNLVSSSCNSLICSGSDLFFQSKSISFFPQGLIMCFYGALGLIFGTYLWFTILWRVGSGFNEFNKETGVVRIFRWGLPGKERRIDFRYNIKDIEALRVCLKEGVNPRRTLALQIKGKGEIPLTRIGQPIALQDIESEASSLAAFLQISLETFYKM